MDVDEKDLTTEIELPSITAKNTDETKTDVIEISSEKLGEMLKDEYYNNDTGEYVYTETDANGKEYTYKVKKTEDTKPLTNKQLADRLGEGFTGDDNGVYYKGEKLNLDQMEAVRKTLSYTVEVTEVTKTPGQVEGGQESIESAEETAKLEAIKAALTDAAKKTGINVDSEDFKNQLNTMILPAKASSISAIPMQTAMFILSPSAMTVQRFLRLSRAARSEQGHRDP